MRPSKLKRNPFGSTQISCRAFGVFPSSPQGGGSTPNLPREDAYPRSSGRRIRIGILRLRLHVDLHLHPELVVRAARIGAGERHRLAGIARDRDADEIAVADDAVGG